MSVIAFSISSIRMPAFDESAYYVIFFVVFLVICYFVYMNIILAVIYNNYRKHLKVISTYSLTLFSYIMI